MKGHNSKGVLLFRFNSINIFIPYPHQIKGKTFQFNSLTTHL